MRKLVALTALMLAMLPFVVFGQQDQPTYNFRKTVEVTENAGVQRFSYPVNLNLPAKDISSALNDIRITDIKGAPLLYEIAGKTDTVVSLRFPIDLLPNEKKTFYAYYGNKTVDRPKTFFGGVQQYSGMKFVTYAWGTVKISSYSKNNTISITDNSNRMIRDADGNTIAQETYNAGTVRSFTLASPAMLRITCTGVSSVAVGNFKAEETDSDALISGNILVYVPKFLAITSFHANNKVQVWNRGEIAEEKILNAGESMVFDGISSGFRRVTATSECLIQYGTASAFSYFSVPGRGNVYRFLPLGPVWLSAAKDTEIDVIYPDGKPTDKFTAGNGQPIKLDTESYLKNIGSDKTVKALQIRSSAPITVLGSGGAGGHGATYLFGDDGLSLSNSWNTMTGDIDRENPIPRNIRLLAPFSNTIIDQENGIGSLFPQLLQGGLAISFKEFSVEHSSIQIRTKNEKCFLLDGNPDDSATFFQVPVLSDQSVKIAVPSTETVEGGWVPGIDRKPEDKTIQPSADDSGQATWFSGIIDFIKNNPLTFALILIGLAIILILVASVFIGRRKIKAGNDSDLEIQSYSEKPEIPDSPSSETYAIDSVKVYQEPENPLPAKKKDWFDMILDDKSNQDQNSLTFKAPKLRAPKISQLMSDIKPGGYSHLESNSNKQEEHPRVGEHQNTDSTPPTTEDCTIPETSEPAVNHETTDPHQEQPEPTKTEVNIPTEMDKINITDSKFNPMAKNLAQKLCAEGVVADPGAIVRLGREGILDMFTRIVIVSSAVQVIPGHISNLPIFEKIVLTQKEIDKANKLAKNLGIFEEVAKAIVLAEKNNIPNLLSSAKLPERLGKLKVTSIDSFC